MKVPSVECPLFHLKLYHISTKLFHFVVVDVEDRSHASFVLFLFIYEGCLLTFHTSTTGTTPSQGATAAVCSVRLHSSVLLRTNVKCFFVFVQDATTVGEPLLLHFSLPPADQCHHRYQPFSRSHCCSVFGKTPFLGTFENKCEVFFLSLSRMPPL